MLHSTTFPCCRCLLQGPKLTKSLGNVYPMVFRSGLRGEVGHYSSAVLLLGTGGGDALQRGEKVELPLVMLDSLGQHEPDRVREDVVAFLLHRVCPEGTPRSHLQLKVACAKGCQNDTVSCGAFAAYICIIYYAARVISVFQDCRDELKSWPPAMSHVQGIADAIAKEVKPYDVQKVQERFRYVPTVCIAVQFASCSPTPHKSIVCCTTASLLCLQGVPAGQVPAGILPRAPLRRGACGAS